MNFKIKTKKNQELVDITEEINNIIKKTKIKQGLCSIFVKHATAAIVINENYDPNICIDFLNSLNKAFPDHDNYLHDMVDNNAGAHIKSALLGPSEIIPIRNNRLDLGTWQSVMLVELDGPKERTIIVKIIPTS